MRKVKKLPKRLPVFFIVAVAVMTVGVQRPSFAEDQVTEVPAKAMTKVNRMAEYLSQAKSLSVNIEMGFDVVQATGQKVEFGETRKIVLQRPDHLRVDEVKRDGAASQITFDGKELSLYYPKANVYAAESKPGTVDEMIKYFTEDLDLRLPLAQMLSLKLPEVLSKMVDEAALVEVAIVSGVPCDHLALRGEDVDLQVWTAKGSQPLPQRVVITYKKMEGQPQFWANFSNWNLSPEISEGMFSFIPAEGAKKIAFSPKQVMGTDREAEPAKKEGKS